MTITSFYTSTQTKEEKRLLKSINRKPLGVLTKIIKKGGGDKVDTKIIDVVEKGYLEGDKLFDEEKEIALTILNALSGTLAVRAKPILKFCLKALEYVVIRPSN